MSHTTTSSNFGTVEFDESRCERKDGSLPIVKTPGRWVPSPELVKLLPPGFQVPICRIEVGEQRVHRLDDFNRETALRAATAGEAILEMKGLLTPEVRATYRGMRFLFRLDPRERLKLQEISSSADLLVRPTLQKKCGIRDVLPDDFGGGKQDAGKVRVGRLMADGRQAAIASGIANPTPSQAVTHGIAEEAARFAEAGCETAGQDIAAELRFVFFDLGPATVAVDELTKERVFERWCAAISKKAGSSATEFDQWFEKRDNIYHQIGKQVKNGEAIPRAVVRQALIELAYDSLTYLGSSIDAFAKVLRQHIGPELTGDPAVFDVVNRAIPDLGNLPLVLIHTEWPGLEIAIQRILANLPASPDWRQVRRMLHTFSWIAVQRRKVELAKKRSPRETQSLTESGVPAGPGNMPSGIEEEVVHLILEQDKIECECGVLTSWCLESGSREGDVVELNLLCVACGARSCKSTTQQELKKLREDSLDP